MNATTRVTTSRAMTIAVLALSAAYFLLPVWWLVVAATKSQGDLFNTDGLWFSDFHLFDNLHDLVTYQDGIYLKWFRNSVLYSGIGAVVGTLLSAMAGYALAKYTFRGREAIFNTVLGAVLVPAPMLALPLYLMFTEVHLVNTFWAVFLPSIISPFGVYLCRVYAAASVPDELIDAGRVDGAGDILIFFTVAIPLMKPALVTVFLFQSVGIWNNFLLPQTMLTDIELWPLPVGLSFWSGQRLESLYSLTVVGALVSVIPLAVAFVSLQRFWRAGLASGSFR